MAVITAQQSRASIGLLHASGVIRTWSASSATDMLEVSTLLDTSKQFITGQTSSQLNFGMILDVINATNSQFNVLTTWKGSTDSPVDIAPAGYATGNTVWMVNALETQVTTSAAEAGTVDAAVTAIGDGMDDWGISIEDYTGITITGNGTARDSGIVGGTANGGVAHLHVTAISNTSDTVTIEHSVDGSTSWATLVTFTAATTAAGPTSQRVVVAAGTTVRKFLRVVDTVVGAGTTTRQVSFARR